MKAAIGRGAALAVGLLIHGSGVARDADLVLRNGDIWTVDDDRPRVEAVASAGGRIVYAGPDAGVDALIGDETRVIDLAGRFVVPGFNDNHVHFESTGRLLYGLNLLDVSDEQGFATRIREVHERFAPGTWITGGDWSAYETWAESGVASAGRRVDPDDPYGNLFEPHRRQDASEGQLSRCW